jgi:predicted metal-dependent hydrolase
MTVETLIDHTVKRSTKSRRMSISVRPNGEVVLSLPHFVPLHVGRSFLHSRLAWVRRAIERAGRRPKAFAPLTKAEYSRLRKTALTLVQKQLELSNQQYGFSYRRVSIRNQSTRWGSSSTQKTLSFNVRLALIDPRLVEYVVVHELCHLKQMNHSIAFWDLVKKTIPDFKARRRALKALHLG